MQLNFGAESNIRLLQSSEMKRERLTLRGAPGWQRCMWQSVLACSPSWEALGSFVGAELRTQMHMVFCETLALRTTDTGGLLRLAGIPPS